MTAVIFFTAITLSIAIGGSASAFKAITSARLLGNSNQSFFAAESLGMDVASRLDRGMLVDASESLDIGTAQASVVVTTIGIDQEILATGNTRNAIRSVVIRLAEGSGAAFHFGIQSGVGGIILENSSSVKGNVYSSGTVVGSGSNIVRGDVISAGPTGLVQGVHATSTVRAHTIANAYIEKDARYQSISNSTVLGTLYPGSPDEEVVGLPIEDALIDEWKTAAADGGVISSPCPYKITSNATIGNTKINCDLEISGTNFTITLSGPVWVSGNITISNSPTIRIDPSLGNQGVPIIADNESNRLTSSKISISNSAVFEGSGLPKSYVLFVSGNRSAENGGSEKAIEITNSVSGKLLVYSNHGEILIANNVDLREVTAYRIRLKNSAVVNYETGLASLLFSSGPGGGYTVDSWQEVE